MTTALAYTIQPGDEALAADLLAGINATIAENLGAGSFYAYCATATPGAHGILQGAVCAPGGAVLHGYAVTRQISPSLGRRLFFSPGAPLADPTVPEDADPVADEALADGLWTGTTGIEAVLTASPSAAVVSCPGATPGAIAILLYRGRLRGWNSALYFPANGVQRVRYSKA